MTCDFHLSNRKKFTPGFFDFGHANSARSSYQKPFKKALKI